MVFWEMHRHKAFAPFITLALCSIFGCEVPDVDTPDSETKSGVSTATRSSETDVKVRDMPTETASEWKSATHPVVFSWTAPWEIVKGAGNKDTEIECIQVFTTRDQKMSYVIRISSDYSQEDLPDETLNEALKKQILSMGESALVLDEGPAEIHGKEFYRIRGTYTNAGTKYCTYIYNLRDGTRNWGLSTSFPFDQESVDSGELPAEYSSLNVTIGDPKG